MISILRRSALALAATAFVTIGLLIHGVMAGTGLYGLLAIGLSGGSIIGACATGVAFSCLEMKHEKMSRSIADRLSRSYEERRATAHVPETNYLIVSASNDNHSLPAAA